MKIALPVAALLLLATPVLAADPPAGLQRLDFLIGRWQGASSGESGKGTVERECERILGDRFIECRSMVTYPPQEKNPKGEVHVERAIYSFDKSAKKLVLRQFHGEGFVNTYVQGDGLAFTTVSIENIPAGWQARETYEVRSADSFVETFELAAAGKEFGVYSASTLQRVK